MAEISVVIPTYNRAGLIGETIEAVLAQSQPPDEIIVVDDGSSDETLSVLAAYAERLKIISIGNGGELVARNTGLKAATGRLVAFCDSDDLWTPDFLGTMSMQWQHHPQMLACYANFRILQAGSLSERAKFDDAPNGFWTGLRPAGEDSGVFDQPIVQKLLLFQPFFPSCMMVSRERFLDVGGWDEATSRLVGCDFATTLRVAARPPVGVVARPMVAIRKHGGNFSGDTEKMNLGDARVLEHVLASRPELAPLAAKIQASIAIRRRAALDSAFSRRDFAAVRGIYAQLTPAARQPKQALKRAIAGLPGPFNTLLARLTSR